MTLSRLRSQVTALVVLGFASFVGFACENPSFVVDEPTGMGGTSGTGGVGGEAGEGSVGHCGNQVQDEDETDLNCGGLECAACAVGQMCLVDRDCVNEECTDGRCQSAACTDTAVNGSETGLNCGGGECPPCEPEQPCKVGDDCTSTLCEGGVCTSPSCTDRVKNGSESDVDCGGPDCPGCAVGDTCVVSTDCEEPVTETASVRCSSDDLCELVCGADTADCNDNAADGCETKLNTDLDHCGACDAVCAPDHAEGSCDGGMCTIQECTGNYRDCNVDPSDGCEANINTDPDNCSGCGMPCDDTNGTPSCSGGECGVVCDEGYGDCNMDAADGCETNLGRDVNNCGECQLLCEATAPESPFCDPTTRTCDSQECPAGTGACDGDGNCNDDLTVVGDCGRCGNTCRPPHAVPSCEDSGSGYTCGIASCMDDAQGEWEHCDSDLINGCETNLSTNRQRCGSCSNNCDSILAMSNLHVATTRCNDGGCQIASCETGYADCDGGFANGCEVNTNTSNTHCGGCNTQGGTNCNQEYANATGSCSNGACQFTGCNSNRGDCNEDAVLGKAGNGCETITSNNDSHCGACGVVCVEDVRTSSNSCVGTSCMPTCSSSSLYANCDMQGPNGCEVSLTSDEDHCGSCTTVCDASGSGTVTNTCGPPGVCTPGCASGFKNCDSNPNNGCERSITTTSNCGDCAAACSGANDGTASCNSSGECSVSCGADFKSCNNENQSRDGCETDVRVSTSHCGGCGAPCSGANGGSASCSMGQCSVGCGANFKSCNNENQSRDGCETDVRTSTSHCGACGNACTGTTPYCVSSKCLPCQNPVLASTNPSQPFQTTESICLRVPQGSIAGWGCYGVDDREITVNGVNVAACGDLPVPPGNGTETFFHFGPGGNTGAHFWWW